MTNAELKDALLHPKPVTYMGIRYDCVSGIIYRNRDGKIEITAELMDRISNSTSVVNPDRVRLVSEE